MFWLTRGVSLSVFLLTNTGLSYLTNDAFGGIILSLVISESNKNELSYGRILNR